MATRFNLRRTTTIPSAIPEAGGYRDATVVAPSLAGGSAMSSTSTILADNSKQIVAGKFYSDRLTQTVTISGTITINLLASANSASPPIRMRARISKETAGGGAVETDIATGDQAVDLSSAQATNTFTITPADPVTVYPDERLILRLYSFPPGGVWGTGFASLNIDTSAGASYFEFTETFTSRANALKLYLRRTSTIAIGGFMDMLEQLGSTTQTTAVVSTGAGLTEKQWTKTSGGALAEWISNRFTKPWTFVNSTDAVMFYWVASESNVSANCGFRFKLFKRAPDGTETQCYSVDSILEMSTAGTIYKDLSAPTPNTNAPTMTTTSFNEDDRLVLRFYIYNVGTMASGFTCTVQYDHNLGTSLWLQIFGATAFKAEGAPGQSFVIPTGTPTTGIGNGQ